MLDWDHEEINEAMDVPEKYQLPCWYECDDIDHMNSVEFHDTNILSVYDITDRSPKDTYWNGTLVAEIAMTEDRRGSVCNPFSDNNAWKGNNSTVYGQSFEKGTFYFEELVLSEPFDAAKVKFNVTEWTDQFVVDAIEYEGRTCHAEGGDTMGKSMHCWIDD